MHIARRAKYQEVMNMTATHKDNPMKDNDQW